MTPVLNRQDDEKMRHDAGGDKEGNQDAAHADRVDSRRPGLLPLAHEIKIEIAQAVRDQRQKGVLDVERLQNREPSLLFPAEELPSFFF
jgi:hypothetical protein